MVMLGMRMRKMVGFNVTVYAFHLSIYFAQKEKIMIRDLTFEKVLNNKHNLF